MDKRIYSILQHSLFESLFSDIIDDGMYDGYDDDEKTEVEQATQGEEVMQDMRLTDCVNREDVLFYLQESTGVGEAVRQAIWKIKDVCYGRDYRVTVDQIVEIVGAEMEDSIKNFIIRGGGLGFYFSYMDLTYDFILRLVEDTQWIDIPGVNIQAKPFYITFGNEKVGPFINQIDGSSTKFSDGIRDFVDSQINDDDIVNLINAIIIRDFNANKIVTELTAEPKPYPVTQKDITRMANIIRSGKGAIQGFNAITKADKMVARLAAYFICADHFNIATDQLKSLDEEALLRIFTGVTRNSRSSSAENLCKTLNRDIFQGIHLVDVLYAYKRYKDRNWDFVSTKV